LDYETGNSIFIKVGKSQGKGIFLFKDISDIEDWK
jgi:hypothetical protein